MNGANTTRLAVIVGAFALPIVVIGVLVNLLAGGGLLGFAIVIVIVAAVTSAT